MSNTDHITAKVILNSKNLHTNVNLTTLELEYPRYIHCFDDETEILCKKEYNEIPLFRKFKQIYDKDYYVAQVTEDLDVEFVKPKAAIRKYIEEDIVSFNNARIDFKVTKDHRMFVGSRKSKGFYKKEIILAKELINNFTVKRFYKKGVLSHNERVRLYPPLIKLIAYFISDGTSTKTQTIFHLKKDRKIKEVSRLLELCNIQYRLTKYKDGSTNIIFSNQHWVYDCYTPDNKKKLPEFIWNMDSESFSWFKDGLLESDGCINNNEYNNTSEVLIDQLQSIFHINNISFNKRKYGDLFKVKFLTEDSPVLRRDKLKPVLEHYRGDVYCVTVPTGLIMVRRNGIVHISGNCELMTHRVFSRNAQSSRAIPVERQIELIRNSKWYPIFMKNKRGMEAVEPLDEFEEVSAKGLWDKSKREAINNATYLKNLEVHKQIANRVIEPFSLIKVIVTATDFTNFFDLRLGSDAQQEIQVLAKKMKDAISNSSYQELMVGEWHLPYISLDEISLPLDTKLKLSVARCARVSYLNHDKTKDLIKDIELHDFLLKSKHMSPFEHQATPSESGEYFANFNSFIQYRHSLKH